MADDFKVVDVWLGRFPSLEAFERYFEETYDESDSTPLSPFAADMGATWYDHDFVERVLRPETHDPFALLDGLSYSDSYAELATARWKEVQGSVLPFRPRNASPLNAVVLVFGGEIESPRSVSRTEYELHYLGRFPGAP